MTGKEIVARAKTLSDYVYWYGGKGEVCTLSLAKSLKTSYPSVWTDSYYNKAIKDIDGVTKCGDCSFLVCYAYNISQIGSSQIKENYETYDGEAKAGMIGWKSGHVGIYDGEGCFIELRGIDYDYCDSRTISQCGFTAILYDPDVDYNYAYDIGWHYDGTGWWYAYGTSLGSYYKNTIQILPSLQGDYAFAFDSDGYLITDSDKILVTDYGNIYIEG